MIYFERDAVVAVKLYIQVCGNYFQSTLRIKHTYHVSKVKCSLVKYEKT